MNTKNLPWRFIWPVLILVFAAIVFKILQMQATPPEQKPLEHAPPLVATEVLNKQAWPFSIDSQAIVQAKQTTIISSQISGKIDKIAQQFDAGFFLEEGAVLVEVSQSNYLADVKSAKANLSLAQANLQEELARGDVAKVEWQAYGDQASDLALRKPQIAAQTANVEFAKAQLDRAERELKRTKISMPYKGVVVERKVSLGDYVTTGFAVAKVIATDVAEIRLPLTLAQYQKLKPHLPQTNAVQIAPISVELFNNLAQPQRWTAQLARIEQVVESDTQIIYAVAQINDPYNLANSHAYPLAVGQFVKAKITLEQTEQVFRVARSLLTPRQQLLVVNGDVLRIRTPNIVHQELNYIYVDKGLEPNDLLVVSALSKPVDGMRIRLTKGTD
ncbi:efflux RND transporter periplasmic adaptor subunit [Catenovulum sp. SX2]|uniref:efflux RND transporter periplasmic adaptor subunit n=1 Tax=Catenovulum sp. SX2 TaxID=3398614 RepID=UPI003F845620